MIPHLVIMVSYKEHTNRNLSGLELNLHAAETPETKLSEYSIQNASSLFKKHGLQNNTNHKDGRAPVVGRGGWV